MHFKTDITFVTVGVKKKHLGRGILNRNGWWFCPWGGSLTSLQLQSAQLMLTRGFWRTTNEHHQTKLAHPIHCTLAARTSRDRTTMIWKNKCMCTCRHIHSQPTEGNFYYDWKHPQGGGFGFFSHRPLSGRTRWGPRLPRHYCIVWTTWLGDSHFGRRGAPPPVAETFPRGSATVLTQWYRSVHTSHTCAQNKYTWCLMWNSL